jgi:hypothetical protein
MAQNKLFTVDSGDIKGFMLGIAASILAVYLLDKHKQKNGKLEYGEKKLLEEIQVLKAKLEKVEKKI